LAVLGVKEVG
jgi:hypothetical protein